MNAIQKAQSWARGVRQSQGDLRRTPQIFRPPTGGAQFSSQGYRWEQALHLRGWVSVAIGAWMSEIAGGEAPNFGRLVPKEEFDAHNREQGKTVRTIRKSFHGRRVCKALGGPGNGEVFEAYPRNHPICRLFRNPNGPDVSYDLWAWHILFKKLTGEVHWWVRPGQDGAPAEIWVMPTHWLRLMTASDGAPLGYMMTNPWGGVAAVPWDEVVSFYEHSPLNRYEGWAITQAIAQWIDTDESQTLTRLSTFKNSASPQFHVALDDRYDPDDQFIDRFRGAWAQRFQGEERAGQPLITGPGVEVKALGYSPADIQFVQGTEQLRDMILVAFGVPKAMLGLTDSMTFGSVQAAQASFRKFKVNSELTYTAQVITEKIMQRHDPDSICFWDERITDDELKLRQLQFQFGASAITPNEIRAEYGMEPYAHGGDDPILNGNPVPWGTGEQPSEDQELATEFQKILEDKQRRGSNGEQQPVPGLTWRETQELDEATRPEVARALGESSGSSGGFLVPAEMVAERQRRAMVEDENDRLRRKLRKLETANGSTNGHGHDR